MPKKTSLSLRDLQEETDRFMSPATAKEKAILDAAVSLFGERGIDGATTAEIARRADVTEKTLFRYFPSKKDLVKRVLFPSLLRGGLERSFESLEALLKTKNANFKNWYLTFSKDRIAVATRNPALSRTLLMEVVDDPDLRTAIGELWSRHVRQPMVDGLAELQRNGSLRKEIDIDTLARAIHCMNIGYFLTRYILAPGADWEDDATEIEKMAEILANGCATKAGGGR